MEPDDDELIGRAVGGDTDALAVLLERHDTHVRRGLRIARKWQSVIDVDDIMQVTYLEAFSRIGRFVPAGAKSFVKWLERIAVNNLRDAVRELGRAKRPDPNRRVVSTGQESEAGSLLDFFVQTTSTPSRHAGRSESQRMLDEAIGRLPADYRTVVRLCDLEGKSVAEVGAMMGRSQAAVFMLRARAHDQLQEILGTPSRFFSDSARVRR